MSTDKHWQPCSVRIIWENDNNRVSATLRVELLALPVGEEAPGAHVLVPTDLSNLKMERTHPEFGGCWLPNYCYSVEAMSARARSVPNGASRAATCLRAALLLNFG